jgi:hypothetical protein
MVLSSASRSLFCSTWMSVALNFFCDDALCASSPTYL